MEFKITKNKAFEGYVGFDNDYAWFSFVTRWTKNTDHAGFFFEIMLWKFHMYFEIHDTRHWNYDEQRYFKEGEEAKLHAEDNE